MLERPKFVRFGDWAKPSPSFPIQNTVRPLQEEADPALEGKSG